VIVERTEQTYERAVRSIDSNAFLFAAITPLVSTNRSRYFILESRPNEFTAIINDLLSKRVIHAVSSSQVHPSIRGEYTCFEIDYGMFIDLMRAAEFSTGEGMLETYNPAEIGSITATNKGNYLLDLSPLRALDRSQTLLVCPECSEEFSPSDKAYEIRRICPHCFQDQPSPMARTE
jgi:hypothetical protein